MRVVIDTNVFVSSFFGGIPRKVIDHWFSGRLTLCVSRTILKEYLEVLNRFDFDDKSLLFRLMLMFEKGYNTLFIDKPEEQAWVKADPADNKFIACALAMKAEYIVSGDGHLTRLNKIGKIKIVKPDEMIKVIG